MTTPIEPERMDYGPPVGVLWEATITKLDGVVHKVASPDKEVTEHLIERILAGDLPGNV